MRLPALGARRRTPAHAPPRTPLRARAHMRPPLSEVSQVSQPSRGARNALKTKCALGGTRSVTRCAAVPPPAPFVPGRQGATSRPPDKAVPAPVRRPVRARLCGCALGRVRVHPCASGQAQGTPPPTGVHSGGAACTLRRDGVASRSDGDRLFLRPCAALSHGAAGDSAARGAKRPQIAKKRAMRANGGARGAAHVPHGRKRRVAPTSHA